MYLRLPLHLLLCSAQDTVGIARFHVAAPVGIRGFSIRVLWLHASGSLNESRPGRSVDVEAAMATAAGPAVEAGSLWRTNRLAEEKTSTAARSR